MRYLNALMLILPPFLREGWERFRSLVMLDGHAAIKLFWWGWLFTGIRCFSGGERTAQVTRVCGEVLIAHLVAVRASRFIEHHHETKYFFSGQLDSVLCLHTHQ